MTNTADRPDAADHGITGDAMAASPELAALEARLAEAEARARDKEEQALRLAAEMDNVRKRTQREVENASRFGVEKLALELLPVKDSLDLAIENEGRTDAKSLAEGQRAVLQLLAKAFERAAIVEIDPAGEPFDPALHEAMLTQESATAEPDSVLAVVQRGYALNGRLLRPARVIVAKPPAGGGGDDDFPPAAA